MKKIIVLAMAVCLLFTVAIPAMAVDVDFSGYYRVRGFMNSNIGLTDSNEESEAYYDNRFRLQTVFKVNDYVSLTTRFDALDNQRWGAQNEKDPVRWERIYMDIKTDFGIFTIGHQQAGMWGQDFFDLDYNDDRIKFITKVDDILVGAIIQKTRERDSLARFTPDGQSDADTDVYYLFGIYKKDNIEAGLLGAWARDAAAMGGAATLNKQALLPYWKLAFGDIGVRGEIVYEMGKYDFDAGGSMDIDALSYALEVSYNLDIAKLYAGWVSVSGMDDSGDFTLGNAAYGGLGSDYNPFAILTDDLGGKILNTGAGVATGVNLWYLGCDATVDDKLKVNAIIGQAMANEDWAVSDDEYGMEINVGATYQIMDNLEYKAVLAYLMAGDLLGDGDNYGVMHQLRLSF